MQDMLLNDTGPEENNGSLDSLGVSPVLICEGPTFEEMTFYVAMAWWLEGFIQIIVGCFGFFANLIAIPILYSKEMRSIFNRLLLSLAVIDNVFILCNVSEGIRNNIQTSIYHDYIYAYFLYQFHNMTLCVTIYVTVVLAVERYRAVWKPIEYHNTVNSSNPWGRVAFYLIPVFLFSIIFNLSKFLEPEFHEIVEPYEVFNKSLNTTVLVNRTVVKLMPSDLRLNDDYVLWYSNVARFVVTGIIPFASLAYLNAQIYAVIKRRRRLTNRPQGASSAAQKAEETRQAVVFFIIVILFLVCHTPRIILNIQELSTLDIIKESLKNGCYGFPYWVLVCASISRFLMTVNSSSNFIIYCFMSKTFRDILFQYVRGIVDKLLSKGNMSLSSLDHRDPNDHSHMENLKKANNNNNHKKIDVENGITELRPSMCFASEVFDCSNSPIDEEKNITRIGPDHAQNYVKKVMETTL